MNKSKEWTEAELKEVDAQKLRKFKCPECSHVNPIMELINTANCLECGAWNKLVENGYVIISNKDWSVIEISED